jgi:2-oxoglutarate dehydrogenase E1 component
MDKYTYIANSDAAYIEELYNSYKQDAASVDEGWQKFFEGYDFYQKFPVAGNGHANGSANGKEAAGSWETGSCTHPQRNGSGAFDPWI